MLVEELNHWVVVYESWESVGNITQIPSFFYFISENVMVSVYLGLQVEKQTMGLFGRAYSIEDISRFNKMYDKVVESLKVLGLK